MKTALVIGISGQDGAYLADLLISKGYRVIGTSRDHELGRFANLYTLGILDKVEMASMAPKDFRSVFRVISHYKPDEIYNLAGQTSVGLSFDQPLETHESISTGTLNFVECIRMMDSPPKFFNAGSSEVFGDTRAPATVKTPFYPRSPYATAKAASIWTVANYREAYSLPACSGILFNHESPLRPARFVTQKIIKSAVSISKGSGEILELGNLDVIRDWGWAPDYMEAVWLMMQRPPSEFEDVTICSGVSYSLKDFLSEAFAAVGLDWQDHVKINDLLLRPTDVRESRGCSSHAEEALGWKAATDFPSLIRKLIQAAQD
jgi:GDPmannose 4,6-dehydratase